MKRFISVLLSVIMIICSVSIMALAADTYTVTFKDLQYDVSAFRNDYIGKYEGYTFGTDYWFEVTNADKTVTEVKTEQSFEVAAGAALEFKVVTADYIEPSSVRMLAYDTETDVADIYNNETGEPFSTYYIAKSSGNTFGLRPVKDMTVSLSEFHLFNDCFMYEFPASDYYTATRVQYDATKTTPEEKYSAFKWGNTKVVYINETIFFKVSIPTNDLNHTYHTGYTDGGEFNPEDTYQVTYSLGTGDNKVTTYLRRQANAKENIEGVNEAVDHYDTATESVDVYKIENVNKSLAIKITGTVTYTVSMMGELFGQLNFDNIEDLDMNAIDVSPIVAFFTKLLKLITSLLKAFGLGG